MSSILRFDSLIPETIEVETYRIKGEVAPPCELPLCHLFVDGGDDLSRSHHLDGTGVGHIEPISNRILQPIVTVKFPNSNLIYGGY